MSLHDPTSLGGLPLYSWEILLLASSRIMVEAFRIKISTETGIWEGPITCCTISGLIPKLVILNALTFLTSFPAWFWYTATSQCTHFSLSSPEPTWSPSLLPHPPCPPSPTHNFFTWKHVSQKSAAFFSLFIFKIMLPSLLLQKYDVILKQIWDLMHDVWPTLPLSQCNVHIRYRSQSTDNVSEMHQFKKTIIFPYLSIMFS